MDNPESNHALLMKFLSDKSRKTIDSSLHNLQGVGNIWFVADPRKRRISYLIQFIDENYSCIGDVAIQEVLWRRGLSPEQGFPAKVTLGPLLDRHGKVMSDKLQTQDVRFWEGLLRTAIQLGLPVYAVNLHHMDIYRVTSMEELRDSDMIEQIWNRTEEAQNWRLLVSKTEIPSSMPMSG